MRHDDKLCFLYRNHQCLGEGELARGVVVSDHKDAFKGPPSNILVQE